MEGEAVKKLERGWFGEEASRMPYEMNGLGKVVRCQGRKASYHAKALKPCENGAPPTAVISRTIYSRELLSCG